MEKRLQIFLWRYFFRQQPLFSYPFKCLEIDLAGLNKIQYSKCLGCASTQAPPISHANLVKYPASISVL